MRELLKVGLEGVDTFVVMLTPISYLKGQSSTGSLFESLHFPFEVLDLKSWGSRPLQVVDACDEGSQWNQAACHEFWCSNAVPRYPHTERTALDLGWCKKPV